MRLNHIEKGGECRGEHQFAGAATPTIAPARAIATAPRKWMNRAASTALKPLGTLAQLLCEEQMPGRRRPTRRAKWPITRFAVLSSLGWLKTTPRLQKKERRLAQCALDDGDASPFWTVSWLRVIEGSLADYKLSFAKRWRARGLHQLAEKVTSPPAA